jgi:predicted component of type VI protein secretion system
MVIQILFRDPRSGSEKKYEFDQSPVRIGRNPLNNVVLEGNFVSGWHGIIRFDNTGTYYFDLGSTNGTCLDGKRLQKNTAIPVVDTTRFTIWMFELIVTPSVPGTLTTPQQRPSAVGTMAVTGRSTEVVQVGATPQIPSYAHSSPSRIIPVGGRMPTPPSHASTPGHAPLPTPNHARVPALVSARSPSQFSTPDPAPNQPTDRLVRCLRIIGAFSEAFMGLKKGYEQFGSEVGVRPLTGTTPLHRARTSQEIVEYVLDPATDPDVCARDLNAVFADMGIHDVALMEGISQSVHTLLAKLDPNALDLKMGAGLWSGAKSKAKWSEYVENFNNLLAEDAALHAEIFGEEFASAYASVALGDEPVGHEDQEDDQEDGE